ncbi:MAG: PQQ-binding-like beta-propeller repeat protein, partial [Gemmataceae bacterium]
LRPGLLVSAVAFSPDGQRLAVWTRAWSMNGHDRFIIFDVATGRELRTAELPKCHLLRLSWLADGRGLAVVMLSRNDYFVWDFTDENTPLPVRPNIDLDRTMRGDVTYQAVAISPDGSRLVTGRSSPFDASAQPIEVWDAKPNADLKTLQPRELGRVPGNGLHLLFSADGKRIFVVSRQQDPPRGPAPGAIGPVQPATPGEQANRSRLTVYEIDTGKTLGDFTIPALQAQMGSGSAVLAKLALSPDGRTLYVGDDQGTIHAYDWAAGKELMSFVAHPAGDPNALQGAGVQALAAAPDGRTLYSAGRGGGLSVWDLQAKPPSRQTFLPQLKLNQIVLSPDASRVAVAEAGVVGLVQVLDAKTGADLVAPRPGHAGVLLGAALAPDGTVMTAGLDRSVRTWDPMSGRELRRQPVDQLRTWLATQPLTTGGGGLFSYDAGRVIHVDLKSGKQTPVTTEVARPVNQIYGVSGTSVFVNTAEGKVRQWDAATGRTVREFDPPHKPDGSSLGAVQVSLSPDARQVVMLSTAWVMSGQFGYRMGSFISFHDAGNGKLLKRWYTKEADFQCCAYSPDGRYLVAAGMNSFSGAGVPVTEPTLPVSPQSGPVLFDTRTGEPIRAFEAPVTVGLIGAGGPTGERVHRITALTISPNGALFAAAQMDGSVCVHELATGALCRRYPGHRSEVTQMLFTPNGRRLISTSHDMTGLVWDVSLAALAKASDAAADRLWADLAKPEWELAGPAVSALAGRPDDLVKLAREQMKLAAGPDVDADALKKLAAQLGDSIFAVRERATAAMARYGREALPVLQEQLAQATSAEQRQRLQQAIQAITRSPVPSEDLRRLRMLALLEQQGTAESRAELQRLAAGFADAALTREAKAALGRMGP